MADFANIILAGVVVAGGALVGETIGIPDWVLVGAAAFTGSLSSAGWRFASKEIYSKFFGFMAIATGTLFGIYVAKVLHDFGHVEWGSSTPFAFIVSMFGAKFTRALATGEIGTMLADAFGKRLKRKIDGEK